MKQDVKLLGENILEKGVDSLKMAIEKHNITPDRYRLLFTTYFILLF